MSHSKNQLGKNILAVTVPASYMRKDYNTKTEGKITGDWPSCIMLNSMQAPHTLGHGVTGEHILFQDIPNMCMQMLTLCL